MKMISKTYTAKFIIPAFLGDAEQKGAWRTPPFKALLREWWRIVAGRDCKYDHTALREAEGRLFGHAWLKRKESGRTWAMKGHVRLKLDHWRHGSLTRWPQDHTGVKHPEVRQPKVDSHLYLGYGPLTYVRQKGTSLKNQNPAINADEEGKLSLLCPESKGEILRQAMQLIHWFGTLGGRSRNGWGSLYITSELPDENLPIEDLLEGRATNRLSNYSRPLIECMERDWPHAFGRDDDHRLLLWKTKKNVQTWHDLMKQLAEIKISFRTSTSIPAANGRFGDRHMLAYPVTHHNVETWDNQVRLANQLRFKVVRLRNGKYAGLAYHLPHGLPKALKDRLNSSDQQMVNNRQIAVWRKIHKDLDQKMTRIQEA